MYLTSQTDAPTAAVPPPFVRLSSGVHETTVRRSTALLLPKTRPIVRQSLQAVAGLRPLTMPAAVPLPWHSSGSTLSWPRSVRRAHAALRLEKQLARWQNGNEAPAAPT